MSKTLALAALAAASLLHAHAATLTVTVVDREGRPAADAVVQVLLPRGAQRPPAAAAPAFQVSQERMQFVPAVTVVPVGASVRFVNNDGWDHHVRGLPGGSSGRPGAFELRLNPRGAAGASAEVVVREPGPVLLGCHLHGSMRGHLFVADSPWVAKTGPDGQVSFEGLPDGTAQVAVWHPDQLLELAPATVSLSAAPAQAAVQLQVVPRRRRL